MASSSVWTIKASCLTESHLASTANTCCQTAAIPQALWVKRKPLPGQIPVTRHNTKFTLLATLTEKKNSMYQLYEVEKRQASINDALIKLKYYPHHHILSVKGSNDSNSNGK